MHSNPALVTRHVRIQTSSFASWKGTHLHARSSLTHRARARARLIRRHACLAPDRSDTCEFHYWELYQEEEKKTAVRKGNEKRKENRKDPVREKKKKSNGVRIFRFFSLPSSCLCHFIARDLQCTRHIIPTHCEQVSRFLESLERKYLSQVRSWSVSLSCRIQCIYFCTPVIQAYMYSS